MTPHFVDQVLVTRDGTRLPLREWDAESGPPQAVIVALHGMSDYSNAFDMPGKAWAKRGITTLAIDQRGFGQALNPGLWAGSDVMRERLERFRRRRACPLSRREDLRTGRKHGRGGGVDPVWPQPFPPVVDGVMLVSPAVWSRADMPALYRVALFMVAHVTPGIILTNSAAGRVVKVVPSDNVPMLIALGKDPLFQKQTRADALYGLVNLMDEARTAPERLTTAPPPILYLHGEKDQIIPPEPAAATIKALGPRADLREYANGYHMLLRDLEGAKVQEDVAAWILAHAPPSLRTSDER